MALNQLRLLLRLSMILLCALSLNWSASAQVNGNNRKALMDFAKSMKLDKGQMEKSIDMLQKSGRISQDEAEKAKKQLEHYSDDDVKAIQEQAIQRIKSGETPESMMKGLDKDSNAQNPSSNSPGQSSKGKGKAPAHQGVNMKKMKEKAQDSESYKEALEYLNN